jgi:perosamine synthetase
MKNFINRLRKIINSEDFTPLHIPIFEGNEIEYVTDCIKSNFVSSVGEYVNKFEKAICEFTGSKYAILTVNGTAALQISFILAGVEENDEVLMPALMLILM